MNSLKKIFLFLAVLLIVLTPGFNKLQAAETFGLKLELTLDPFFKPISSFFAYLTVGFELDNTGPVPENTELEFTWSCNNLILEDGWDQDEDYQFFEGENLSDKVNLAKAENKKIIWRVKSGQILAQNKKYKMIVEDATVPQEMLWKTGGVDEICTITLTINTLTATGDFYVGSPVTIDPTLILDPNTAVVDQALALDIDFQIMPNRALSQGASLTLNLGDLVNNGLQSSDISIESLPVVLNQPINFPEIKWTLTADQPPVQNPVIYTIKIGSDAAKKLNAPSTVSTFDITFVYSTETPSSVALFTVTSQPGGNPTLGFQDLTLPVAEGPGDQPVPIVVQKTPAQSAQAVSVKFRRKGGSAQAADYNFTPGTLDFGIDDGLKSFTVTITDDSDPEGDETIIFELYEPSVADLESGRDEMTLTISANDGAPVPPPGGIQAGSSCDPAIPDSCGADSGLECDKDDRVCVPEPANRNIGTWCREYDHCKTKTGGLELTCDEDEDRCVGAVANVPCMNDDINNNSLWGDTYDEMDSSDRCDTGLYCDPDKGSCQNDFGQGKIPADKLGETADDIRDQIRNIINIALGFLGVAGVIVTIYGGALWMSAAGDDEKVGKAKKTIVSGLIGLVIIGVAWTIVSYVLTITQDIS